MILNDRIDYAYDGCLLNNAQIEIWNFFRQLNLNNSSAITNIKTSKIEIYPNPSQNQIFINPGNLVLNRVEVFDLNGNLLKTFENMFGNSIDMREIKSGTYILRIFGVDFVTQKKIVLF